MAFDLEVETWRDRKCSLNKFIFIPLLDKKSNKLEKKKKKKHRWTKKPKQNRWYTTKKIIKKKMKSIEKDKNLKKEKKMK